MEKIAGFLLALSMIGSVICVSDADAFFNKKYKETIEKLEVLVEHKTEKVASLVAEVDALKTSVASLKKENVLLVSKVDGLENNVKDYKIRVSKKENDLEKIRNDKNNLLKRLEDKETKLKEVEAQYLAVIKEKERTIDIEEEPQVLAETAVVE